MFFHFVSKRYVLEILMEVTRRKINPTATVSVVTATFTLTEAFRRQDFT